MTNKELLKKVEDLEKRIAQLEYRNIFTKDNNWITIDAEKLQSNGKSEYINWQSYI